MKTYSIRDDRDGRLSGFEIENAYISPRRIAELLSKIDRVSEIRVLGALNDCTEMRVRFTYEGTEYLVLEPFGDSSRYLFVSSNSEGSPSELAGIETILQAYEPPMWRKVLGDILTLKPLSWLLQLTKSGR